jgi:hypothetical protein
MDKNINLTFTEKCFYRLEFSPAEFWRPFAEGYDALPWEKGEQSLVVVAESYSYLLDVLVQARLFNLGLLGKED